MENSTKTIKKFIYSNHNLCEAGTILLPHKKFDF